MCRWVSTQPLPSALCNLLKSAGWERIPWTHRINADALVFVPPHLVISVGKLPTAGITCSYQMMQTAFQETEQKPVHLNGERLLSFNDEDLIRWHPNDPLPGEGRLLQVEPLDAAITTRFLCNQPRLEEIYIALDQQSERGGSDPDLAYRRRLETSNNDQLLNDWNRLKECSTGKHSPVRIRSLIEDLEEVAANCLIDKQEAERKATQEQRYSPHILQQLRRQRQLIARLLILKNRLMAS